MTEETPSTILAAVEDEQAALIENCPVCQHLGPDGVIRARDHYIGTEEEFTYKRCPACGHLWLWVAHGVTGGVFGRGEFDGYDEARFTAIMDHPLLTWAYHRPRAAWLGRNMSLDQTSSVLDVGCGTGELLRRLGQRYGCRSLVGVDINPFYAQLPPKPGVKLVTADFEEFETDQCFDLIIMLHAIEHFDDPEAVVRKTLKLLKPGGYLYVETPASDSVAFKVFGANWVPLMPPYHRHVFSRRSLHTILSESGESQCEVDVSGISVPLEITLSSWAPIGQYALVPFRKRRAALPVKLLATLGVAVMAMVTVPLELLVAATAGLVDKLSRKRLLFAAHQRVLYQKSDYRSQRNLAKMTGDR